MTDKRIKSYLEDRLEKLENIKKEREWTTSELGDIACCKQTLAFIDSMQEEPVSENLEEVATTFADVHVYATRKVCFKAGAQWQKAKDKEIIETAIHHAYHNGRFEMKEQMMKNAIDGKVLANGMGNPILHLWDKGRHLIDKKVKVIVIEED